MIAARLVTVTQVGQVLMAEWEVVTSFTKYYHDRPDYAFFFDLFFFIRLREVFGTLGLEIH